MNDGRARPVRRSFCKRTIGVEDRRTPWKGVCIEIFLPKVIAFLPLNGHFVRSSPSRLALGVAPDWTRRASVTPSRARCRRSGKPPGQWPLGWHRRSASPPLGMDDAACGRCARPCPGRGRSAERLDWVAGRSLAPGLAVGLLRRPWACSLTSRAAAAARVGAGAGGHARSGGRRRAFRVLDLWARLTLSRQRATEDFGLGAEPAGEWSLPATGAAFAHDQSAWWPLLRQHTEAAGAAGAARLVLDGAVFTGLAPPTLPPELVRVDAIAAEGRALRLALR